MENKKRHVPPCPTPACSCTNAPLRPPHAHCRCGAHPRSVLLGCSCCRSWGSERPGSEKMKLEPPAERKHTGLFTSHLPAGKIHSEHLKPRAAGQAKERGSHSDLFEGLGPWCQSSRQRESLGAVGTGWCWPALRGQLTTVCCCDRKRGRGRGRTPSFRGSRHLRRLTAHIPRVTRCLENPVGAAPQQLPGGPSPGSSALRGLASLGEALSSRRSKGGGYL